MMKNNFNRKDLIIFTNMMFAFFIGGLILFCGIVFQNIKLLICGAIIDYIILILIIILAGFKIIKRRKNA